MTIQGPRAHASGPTVTGAGSTWVQPALDTWRGDINRQGYTINYQGVGSSAGRNFFIINQVDFAASEIPFQPDELRSLQGENKSFQYLPDVAGATTLMYDLHSPSGGRITSLRLDAAAATKIFTGAITSWHDPAIRALNPGLQIKEDAVIPVVRSDGSGTSAQLSLYFADQDSGDWNGFVSSSGCPAPCSQWPQFGNAILANGSDSVANYVANTSIGSGAIGYVEAAYAFSRGFPVAAMRNGGGSFVQLTVGDTAHDVAVALTHARLHADLTQDLTAVYRATEPDAYPMSSYSYMITQTTGFDPAKGAVLGAWLIYIACQGQQEVDNLGYSPLPPNLVRAVFDAIGRIPGGPRTPPIDSAHCANPTVTNPGSVVGTSTSSTSSGSSSSSGSRTNGGSSSGGGSTGASGGSSQSGAGAGGTGAVALAPQGGATGAGAQGQLPGTAAGAGGQEAAGPGENLVSLPSGQTLRELSDTQKQDMAGSAEAAAASFPSPSAWPLYVVAAVLLVVCLVPLLWPRRGLVPGSPGDPRLPGGL